MPLATYEAITRKNALLCLVTVITILSLASPCAQGAATLTTLYSFTGGPDGANPASALVQDKDGALYGTTVQGGDVNAANGGLGSGTVFCLRTNGDLAILHAFRAGDDGSNPYGLIWGADGCLYGTTDNGGYDERNNLLNGGTIFKITTRGELTNLWVCAAYALNGARPNGLVWGKEGDLYGTAMVGGGRGDGTVFRMTPQGALTYCARFDGTNGSYPNGALIQGADGNFYGTTRYGGQKDVGLNGTVFRCTADGDLSRLCEFLSSAEVLGQPNGSLVEGADRALYGTTFGSVFRVTTNGVCSPIYAFTGGPDGYRPYAGLVRGTDGAFYGTTSDGGQYFVGTVFKITANGVLTTLASFAGTNGARPHGALLLGQDGNFYGTTYAGGISNAGTIFRLRLTPDPTPLSPPVTIALQSDAATFAASLGTNTGPVITARLESGDTSGLLFEPAVVGEYDNWIQPPRGLPLEGVHRVHIPPANGANGFYKVNFELPVGFWMPSLLGRATVFGFGRVFLNGNLLSVNLSDGFETTNVTYFKTGPNEVIFSDANYLSVQYGFVSGAAFKMVVTYQPAPVIQVSAAADSTLSLTWNAVAGQRYLLQSATNLVQTDWLNSGEPVLATGATISASEPASAGSRYYRVQIVP